MLRYGFIAAGNIIRSMHRGAEMNEDYNPAEIGIYDINEEVRKDYAARGYKTFDSMKELIDNSEMLVLGVTPKVVGFIIDELAENYRPDQVMLTVVTGVEMFRKTLDYAEAGDNIGVLLRGVQREEVERGQVLAKPGTIHPHTKFKAQVYVLTKDEGGRHTPFFNGYRPQFYFRTTDVTGLIDLPEGTEMVMPGDNIDMTIELITPIAIEQGLRFAIREGGKTVGSGVVSEVIE